MTKETAIIVCPGRGTYTAQTLGYLRKHHADKSAFLGLLDEIRHKSGQMPITELDAASTFSSATHLTGDNASLLIYACAMADIMSIDRSRYDIVAVTGNSMGWYLALACAEALSLEDGAHLVNTMGTLMHEKAEGGQIVYPIVDEQWHIDQTKKTLVEDILQEAATNGEALYPSIHLGGMIVLAGDRQGLATAKKRLPKEDIFPLALAHHGAFHSPLLDPIVPIAQNRLPQTLFRQPSLPMVDGRGVIWSDLVADLKKLHQYTLGHQINRPYNFTKAIEIAVKEFAPDKIILPGPGTTLGGAIAQSLIEHRLYGITDKENFKKIQQKQPVVISMDIPEQRNIVT